ncbi:MAG: glycoside hydrolase family 3 C-terminal domain-containing protein [Bryobacteraceae bacterium]
MLHREFRRTLLAVVLLAGVQTARPQQVSTRFKDTSLSPEERARDLVAQMTLEEKAVQMQNAAPAIPRLGIPAYDWWNEALHGVARAGLATVFPQAIGLAATWDTDLEARVADAISTEARAKYNDAQQHDNHARYYGLTFWSPNINIFRDPRWGRGQETYGEDPYLTSRMAIAFIRAMQGNDSQYFKTIATSKHYAVHSGPETTRHHFDAQVSEDDLDNTYLYAFKATITEGGADSIMCAYNRVNGSPACSSDFLLKDKLRMAWNFKGYVVSDCDSIDDIYRGHHTASSAAEASALAVKAGTDLDCGRTYRTLPEAVRGGLISEKEIGESVQRLFVARIRLGMFDPPERIPFSKIAMTEVQSPAHQKISLEAAEKSITLLKNEGGLLPFRKIPKRIAVVGPSADDPDALLANYNGIPAHIITPLEGIQLAFGKKSDIRFALGATYVDSATALVPQNVLRPKTGATQHGLTAEYFADDNLSGNPVLSRTENRGYFLWDMQEPAVVKSVPRQAFSVRWSGTVEVTQPGDYRFGVLRAECHSCGRVDSARLYMDDQLQVDDNAQARDQMSPKTATVHLEPGKPHPIRVEYRAKNGGGGVQLVWKPPAEATLADAIEAAKQSDAAIVCIGLNAHLEGEESKVQVPGFSGGDRTDINLPAPQEKLLKAVLDTGKPTVVVLVNGSALAVKKAKDRAAALLEAWYPGQEGGTAIANTLTGVNNPGGRLPVTFYESIDQLPPFDDYSMKGRTYRYFTGTPLYPFGYGLSYSDFGYSDLSVKAASSKYEVSAMVQNNSKYDGDEVVQLYLSGPDGKEPLLRGFERIHLKRGEKKPVHFAVEMADTKSKSFVSIGGGQPSKAWTGDHFVQGRLGQ